MSGEAVELRTPRLVLRQWREADRDPWAALNADPEVMRHFASTLSRAESDHWLDVNRDQLAERGWGLWAVDVVAADEPVRGFIGFVGLAVPTFEGPPFLPAVEVGWRLARSAWGRGYATEAAEAAVGHAFEDLGLDELVSFTPAGNGPSRRVMERLGMTHDPADDFDHPRLQNRADLRRFVLYRLAREHWTAARPSG